MDPPFYPLVDLCHKPVFKFLSIEPRKRLAQKCPGIRKLHRELPFHFEVVKFGPGDLDSSRCLQFDIGITLDGADWDRQKCLQDSRDIRLDFTDWIEMSNDKFTNFFRYYFGREGTTVGKFVMTNPEHPIPLLRIHKLQLTFTKVLDEDFFENYQNVHFQDIELCSWKYSLLRDTWGRLEGENISTDCLVIRSKEPFGLREGQMVLLPRTKRITRKVCFLDPMPSWRSFCDACHVFQMDSDELFPSGTQFKGFLVKMADGDWMNLLRKELSGEFKYSNDGIGVCIEMTGNRELFVYYQLINDKNLFTAEIMEKGTTKHYHQLPMDQQKKFRDKEDDRNRVRVITTDNNKEKSPKNHRRSRACRVSFVPGHTERYPAEEEYSSSD